MVILKIHKLPLNLHILICKLQCYQCTSRATYIDSMNVCVNFFFLLFLHTINKLLTDLIMSVTVTIADRRPERRDANGLEDVAMPCSGRASMSVICLYVNALQAVSQF